MVGTVRRDDNVVMRVHLPGRAAVVVGLPMEAAALLVVGRYCSRTARQESGICHGDPIQQPQATASQNEDQDR